MLTSHRVGRSNPPRLVKLTVQRLYCTQQNSNIPACVTDVTLESPVPLNEEIVDVQES